MISREQIEATPTFKALENTRKIVTGKKANIDYLKGNYIIANTIGFEAWEKQCGTSQINRDIIKNLIGA